ncbi:FG-GAP-like repeat-containing protein [bacterium]|nr:FG-GAP-like repeat-containing protein [bacterium]
MMQHKAYRRAGIKALKGGLFFLFLLFPLVSFATTYTVSKTADTNDGTCDADCSLREAITAANGDGNDTIDFNISGCGGVCTITPTSALPTISGSTITINGYSQSGASAGTNDFPNAINSTILIKLDGISAGSGAGANGLTISGSNVTVMGLSIVRFGSDGIEISGTAANVKIQGNYIGVDTDGDTALGNSGTGIYMPSSGANSVIGTDGDGSNDAGERNIIAGNSVAGLHIESSTAVTVAGNFFGTDKDGDTDLGNTYENINVAAPSAMIGTDGDGTYDAYEGNLISGSAQEGISVGSNGDNSVIAGNYIGTTLTGNAVLQNDMFAIYIASGGNGVRIGTDGNGTADANEKNIIAGSVSYDMIYAGANNAVIAGNSIGIGADGTSVLTGNYGVGVVGSGTRIGTDDGDVLEANVICNMSSIGINIWGGDNTTIAGNRIGIKAGGGSCGNSREGIYIWNTATGTTIGGTTSGKANIIANNGGSFYSGITVEDANSTGTKVLRNSIYNNGSTSGLALSLYTDLQALNPVPVFSGDSCSGTDTVLTGTATANSTVQVFDADSDNQEGQTYIGETTTDGGGAWTYTITDNSYKLAGNKLVATATDATNGTSQFSSAYTLTTTCHNTNPSVTLSGGASISETGGTQDITATLSGTNNLDVVVTLSVSGTATGSGTDYTLSSTTITIPAGDTTGTATISAAGDTTDEENETVIVDIASVTYGTESGTQQQTVTITDDDAAPTVTLGLDNSSISEAGGAATFTATLSAASGKDVTVNFSYSGTTGGVGTDYTVSGLIVTITAGSTTGSFTATAINDSIDENDETLIVDITTVNNATESGTQQQTTTINDNDTAGTTVSKNTATTTEAGGTDTYTVVLNSEPTADVTIGVSSSDTTEGTVSPSSLTFTSGNWNVPQTVTITGVNDAIADGNITYYVNNANASSADSFYNNLSVADLTVSNTDNDTAGVTLTQSGGSSSVTEGGVTDTYTIALNTEPTSDVTINLSGGSQLTPSPSSLIFTSANYSTPQTVTITAIDDDVMEGSHSGTITHTATSGDGTYDGITISNITVNPIVDNDTAGVTVAHTSGNTVVAEGGATDTYTVVLSTEPTNNVTVTLTHDAQVTLSDSALTFTSGNWDTPQSVTVTAVDDEVTEGSASSTITHTASSSDTNYNGISVGSLIVNISDNETKSVSIFESDAETVIDEDGTTDTYLVVLTARPSATVNVTVLVDDAQACVSPTTLSFTRNNWSTPQTVTVEAVDDSVYEGDHHVTLSHLVTSLDLSYNGLAAPTVVAAISDNDDEGDDADEGDEGDDEETGRPEVSITGPAIAAGGTTQSYTASVLNASTYEWSVRGQGTLLSSPSASTATVSFNDSNGQVVVHLTVSSTTRSANDSYVVDVVKSSVSTSDDSVTRYSNIKAGQVTSSGSLIAEQVKTVSGRGSVYTIDFDDFVFYGLTSETLVYQTSDDAVFIADPTANNNKGIVYRIPNGTLSGKVYAWNLPSGVTTLEGQSENSYFGTHILLFDDKIAIHAPGMRIISVYTQDLASFVSLVTEGENVPLTENIFMEAEDTNGDTDSEFYVGGKYTEDYSNELEASLGASIMRGLVLDVDIPSQAEVRAIEGADDWDDNIDLDDNADANITNSIQYFSSDIGDFNGDHLNDLVVSSMDGCHVYVFYGAESLEDKTADDADVRVDGVFCDGLFAYHTRVGDVNGDGYEDVVIAIPMGGSNNGGAIYIIFGGPNVSAVIDISDPSSGSFTSINAASSSSLLGASGLSLADVDGDGILDILMTDEEGGQTSTLVFSISRAANGQGQIESGGGNSLYNNVQGGGGCSLNSQVSFSWGSWYLILLFVVFFKRKYA